MLKTPENDRLVLEGPGHLPEGLPVHRRVELLYIAEESRMLGTRLVRRLLQENSMHLEPDDQSLPQIRLLVGDLRPVR